MNEFLIAIHRDLKSKDASPSPEQMQAAIKPFQDWIGGIAAQNKLVAPPKRWDMDGRVVKQNSVQKALMLRSKNHWAACSS